MNNLKVELIVIYLIFFLSNMFLVSHQLSLSNYPGDFGAAFLAVEKVFNGEIYVPHPLWYLSVHYMKFITLDGKCAAALVTSLYDMLFIYIAQNIYLYFNNNRGDIKLLLYLFIIFVIGPAYLPIFTKYILLGVGSPNLWHNATLLTVKPFALLTIFFTILGMEKESRIYYILAILTLAISIFAKPSFVIAFLPALLIFMLIKKEYSKSNIVFFISISIIAVLILLYQFLNTYSENSGSSIIVSFLTVWHKFTSNVLLSIVLALLFPIIYTILNFKNVYNNNYIVFSWILVIISIIYAAVFAESGDRMYHGNFFWSYMISLSIIYIFVIADYLTTKDISSKYKKMVLNIILIWQVLIGIYCYIWVMRGLDPLSVHF